MRGFCLTIKEVQHILDQMKKHDVQECSVDLIFKDSFEVANIEFNLFEEYKYGGRHLVRFLETVADIDYKKV